MTAICNLSMCREMVIGRIEVLISFGQFFNKTFNVTRLRDCLITATVFCASSVGNSNS